MTVSPVRMGGLIHTHTLASQHHHRRLLRSSANRAFITRSAWNVGLLRLYDGIVDMKLGQVFFFGGA